jgi:hypothetical protein
MKSQFKLAFPKTITLAVAVLPIPTWTTPQSCRGAIRGRLVDGDTFWLNYRRGTTA